MAWRATVGSVALAGALLLAGCGDPLAEHIEGQGAQPYDASVDAERLAEREAAETTTTLDAAVALAMTDYLNAANSICMETRLLFYDALQAGANGDVVTMMLAMEPAIRQAADRLAVLTPPVAEVQWHHAAAVGSFRAGAEVYARAGAAMAAGGNAVYALNDEADVHLEAAEASMTAAGVRDCGTR